MRKINLICFLFVLSIFFIYACNEEKIVTPQQEVDDTNNGFQSKAVAEIFVKNCATSGCHAGSTPSSGLSLKLFSELIKGSSNRSGGTIPNYGGDVVIPFRIQESLLYQMINDNVTPSSPHDAISLSQADIDTIKNWIMNGAKDFNGNLPFSNPSYRVYVCDQLSDKISVIDGDSKVVSAIIDVSQPSLPAKPHMVKERDGFLYVTLISAGKFLKINTSDYSIVGEVSGITKAGMIQISPDGSKAYVSRSSTSDPIFNSVYDINIYNMTLTKEITLLWSTGGVPHGIALTPDGKKLYVANLTLSRIGIIDAELDEATGDISLPPGTEPMQTMISPDGNYLYVSARGTGKLMVFDTHKDTLITEVDVDPMPMQIAITSDGNKIYLGSFMMNTVNVIQKNGNTWTNIKQISHPGFRMLHGCDITSDDKYVYVSSRNEDGGFVPYFIVGGETNRGTIGIIDTQTDEVIKLIEIEESGSGLVVEKNN
ncbi:MAG: YncE family protein [Ignavibacteriaceae bacterium]|jgi:DNA-binding beta-propeller fold protein YncE|nr:YncE family protein [Ignavibacteriaceae bacterium]MCW8814146.1 YncE family protein [Chlorobium sp.]